MAQLLATHDRVLVRFTPVEKAAGLLRDLNVPRSAVVSVEVADDGLRAVRGMWAPGTHIVGVRKIGTWRRWHGWKSLVSVRRGQPAVKITLHGAAYNEVLVGLDDAGEVAQQLTAISPA